MSTSTPTGIVKHNVNVWEGGKDENLLTLDKLSDDCEDRIAKVFAGRTIFITGGTGFLGKVLVEKLLRCCPDIKKIYLLIRSKKGKDPQQRIKDTLSNELFDMVKEQRGVKAIEETVLAIAGDVLENELGISEKDRKLLADEVSIIYHCAATVRFDEPLRRAVFLNTRGTQYALNLAKECKKLDLFIYVSTSYCHLHVKELFEMPYDPPADPHKVIQTCEWLTDNEINEITPQILGDYPNSYAYTKALAEHLVVETFDQLPTSIVRPSIVIPIYYEPISGWTDNINGPTGLLIGAGKGVIRTMYCNSSGYGDFLPVDIAVNGMLVSSWHNLKEGKVLTRVAHMTSSSEIKVSWDEIINLGRWVIENRIPLNGVAWYPGGSMKSNYILHYISMILFHWIPAIFVDCLLYILGYPPVLCRVQRRITKGFEVFEYYANRTWKFDNGEAVKIRREMNKIERQKYVIEKFELDLVKYFENCTLCARRYILKEPDDTIPAARKHMRIMYVIDKFCKIAFIIFLLYMLYSRIFSRFLFRGEPGSIFKSIDKNIV
ncbi:fatty acyl-CoA reductase 1 isoform X2 [Condylostylus longicornis]|nr:fatty acyl-CoA reductase 1 isoform X2 [Condylostylus longicornis]